MPVCPPFYREIDECQYVLRFIERLMNASMPCVSILDDTTSTYSPQDYKANIYVLRRFVKRTSVRLRILRLTFALEV